jgi:nucleotide-binding universal stress UspA family protein
MRAMSPVTSIRRILVPHDFSETADRALALALDLAGPLGARVTIMHAYELLTYSFPDTVALPNVGDIEKASRTALEGVVSRVGRPGIAIDSVLREGSPWSEINGAAKDCHADLIVIGTHGRRGISRALLGSVAEKVVRTAPCPVLTVHGPAAT